MYWVNKIYFFKWVSPIFTFLWLLNFFNYIWDLNYICVSTDLDLLINQASEDSKRQVTQSIAEKVGDKCPSCTAQESFAGQAKPKCLQKEHLKPDQEDANHTLKLSFANGIIFPKLNEQSGTTQIHSTLIQEFNSSILGTTVGSPHNLCAVCKIQGSYKTNLGSL